MLVQVIVLPLGAPQLVVPYALGAIATDGDITSRGRGSATRPRQNCRDRDRRVWPR